MQTEINNCLNVLKKGGIILYPTDTVWGIGCDATNYEAVDKIFKLKKSMVPKYKKTYFFFLISAIKLSLFLSCIF